MHFVSPARGLASGSLPVAACDREWELASELESGDGSGLERRIQIGALMARAPVCASTDVASLQPLGPTLACARHADRRDRLRLVSVHLLPIYLFSPPNRAG